MKVTLEQHGGWSAPLTIDRRAAALTVDSLALPAAAASELARLFAEAESEAQAASAAGARRAPDAMSYIVVMEEKDGRRVVLSQSDADMPPAFAALLDWLQRHAARG